MNPKIILVVLNWNMPADTIECVESCQKTQYDNFEVIIVDNGSKDNSVKQFRERFPHIETIANEENLGYAGGNNVGMKRALEKGADWVLLLNNDTTIDPKMLEELAASVRRHPEAGMLAPKVLYYDDRGVINSLGTSMDWLRLRPYIGECNRPDTDAWPETIERDILVGCGLLVKRQLIEKVGMIDEAFFIFHEEADWCFRSRAAGFKNLVVPGAKMYHKASKTMRAFSALTHYYSTRNFLRLTQKNAGPVDRVKVAAGLSYLSARSALRYAAGDKKLPRAFFLGLWDYFTGNTGKCRRIFE